MADMSANLAKCCQHRFRDSAAGWVQMRCRECAAEVAVTARVCSGCGAPIVGQPPVVADTVVAGISDAAGKAVPAGVARAGAAGAVCAGFGL
jgi:hypothetical protein